MKLGKWTIIDNSSEIWPLGGDCKFKLIKIVSDQLMSILEHFYVGKDGQNRLSNSLTARTVIRVEGHANGTNTFEYVRRLKKTKKDENCSKRSKDSASITVQSFYYYSNTSWDGKVADLVNRRKSDLERCVTCTMNKILESNVPLASNNYFLSPYGIVRCWFLLQDSILVFVCYPHLTRLGTTRVLTTRWAPPVKGNKN